ncbi:MAG: colanic acid biosynthesis pyruvyl transferase WcaK [Moraxellaceae bacterium]
MKALLIGNHTCGNRGDGAILRGLIAGLERMHPGAQFEITSRYPVSSSWLLGRSCREDIFRGWHKKESGRIQRLFMRLYGQLLPFLMAIAATHPVFVRLLPLAFRVEIERMREFDVVIQVGGSFFVDVYGTGQFEAAYAALLAGRPLFLVGHSMGPFGGPGYRWLARRLIAGADATILREPVSMALLKEAGLPDQNVVEGSDTAWLVPPQEPELPAHGWWKSRLEERPLVALTVRELAPFDRRLGISQAAYEGVFVRLAERLIEHGCDVVVVSTCTGIDSYHRDDRMNGLRIAAQVSRPQHMHVLMEELNDVELGQMLGSCALLIGTRLHSVIIAMNFGTPAIAVNYEHKSLGILRQLGLPDLACDIPALLDGRMEALVFEVLQDLPRWRARVAAAVLVERERAKQTVARVVVRHV